MITLQEVLQLHYLSIEKYGGSHGIRDLGMLESALARPFQTFAGEELYPTIYEKASAIIESLIINHPFVDGNKRTGFLAMFALLRNANVQLTASEDDAYVFTINISIGSLNTEEITTWLKDNTDAK